MVTYGSNSHFLIGLVKQQWILWWPVPYLHHVQYKQKIRNPITITISTFAHLQM